MGLDIHPGVVITGQNNLLSGDYKIVAVGLSGELQVVVTSGELHMLSGTGPVVAEISGETVIGKVSGEAINISGSHVLGLVSGNVTAKISGDMVLISGQPVNVSGGAVIGKVSGEVMDLMSGSGPILAEVSGAVVRTPAPTILRAGYHQITSNSGGTAMVSGTVVTLSVRSLPGNADMWLGPAGINSGDGYLLQSGEIHDMEINNMNTLYLFAALSGESISYFGEDE